MNNKLCEFSRETIEKFDQIIVFGDLHGDYFPFSKYLKQLDYSKDLVIFLGDYADRGKYGIETIYTINSLITKHPESVIALKGNHEDYFKDGNPVFNPCDLVNEVLTKKGSWRKYFKETFQPFVDKLYISALIPGEFLFVHGGISNKINSIDDLKYPSVDVERDILWSDPFEATEKMREDMEYKSYRGLGILFGKAVSKKICNLFNVKKIIRSHQPRAAREGLHYNHDERVITVNSTSVYESKPFILKIDIKNNFEIKTEFI